MTEGPTIDIAFTDWFIRLALAAVMSGLVGFERQAHHKSAGLRTHMLVGLGAALFGMLSIYSFDTDDTARIAAQVVTGVGFLGVGAIFREGGSIRGLTTAAGLWCVAAIGLAIAAGELAVATAATVVALAIMWVLRWVEHRVRARRMDESIRIAVHFNQIDQLASILDVARRIDPQSEQIHFVHGEGEFTINFNVHADHREVMFNVLESFDGVTKVETARD